MLKPLYNSYHILYLHTLKQSYIISRIHHRHSLTISQLRFHFWGKIMNMRTEKDNRAQRLFYMALNILDSANRWWSSVSKLLVKNTAHSSRSVSMISSSRMSCHHSHTPALLSSEVTNNFVFCHHAILLLHALLWPGNTHWRSKLLTMANKTCNIWFLTTSWTSSSHSLTLFTQSSYPGILFCPSHMSSLFLLGPLH